MWRSATLEKLWPQGYSTIGSLTYESAAYTTQYCMKKITGDQADEAYQRVDDKTGEIYQVKPPYITMSLKPGLGAKWYDKFKNDVHPGDFCLANGKKMRPPKYYDQLLERVDSQLLEQIKRKRRMHALKNQEDNTPERLEVREKVLAARLKSKKPRSVS